MNESTSVLTLGKGKTVFTKTWLPDDQKTVRANVILVHGLGEHVGRYEYVADAFTRHGIALYGFDHIGHGHSSGKKGCMSYEDAYQIINLIKAQLLESQPDIPIFSYGHSMGGGIVLAYGLKYSEHVRGIIATSPAIGLAEEKSPAAVNFIAFMKKICPNMTVENGLSLNGLCHDKEVVKKYEADPLVHGRISMQLANDLIQTGKSLLANDKPYPVSLLLVQGKLDNLVNPKATEAFAAKTTGADITFKEYEEGFHELHNEPFKDEVISMYIDWITKRI